MKSRSWFLSLLVLALWGLLPAAALAQPPTTETIHEEFDTTEFDTVCSGAVVPIHVTGKSVFHITEFDDGRYHLTGTQVGRFTTTDAGVTYTGRFTIWFGENSNTKSFNGTFTFSATGKGERRFEAAAPRRRPLHGERQRGRHFGVREVHDGLRVARK